MEKQIKLFSTSLCIMMCLMVCASCSSKNTARVQNDESITETETTKEELAIVEVDEKYGVKNAKGEMIIEPTYDYIMPYNGNITIAMLDGKDGIIDDKGNTIVDCIYDDVNHNGTSKNGFISIKQNGKWGYLDSDANVVIAPQFNSATPFVKW